MLKKTSIILFCILSICSCKKDVKNNPVDHNYVKTVATSGTVQMGRVETRTYNSNGFLEESRFSDGEKSVWEYNSGVHIRNDFDSAGALKFRFYYYLDGNNHIDSTLFTDGKGVAISKSRYIYYPDSVETFIYSGNQYLEKWVVTNTHRRVYNGQGQPYYDMETFYNTRTSTSHFGDFRYGMPDESPYLIDSAVYRYGDASGIPGTVIVARYGYQLDSSNRILTFAILQNNAIVHKAVYTYY